MKNEPPLFLWFFSSFSPGIIPEGTLAAISFEMVDEIAYYRA